MFLRLDGIQRMTQGGRNHASACGAGEVGCRSTHAVTALKLLREDGSHAQEAGDEESLAATRRFETPKEGRETKLANDATGGARK